jgi:hypothetical protein
MRQKPSTEPADVAYWAVVPDDLATQPNQRIGLSRDEHKVLLDARDALFEDLRFEHLDSHVGDEAFEQLWRFVCRCMLDRGQNFVPIFMSEQAQEPGEHVCYIPVDLLRIDTKVEFAGLVLLPGDDPSIPPPLPAINTGPPPATAVAVVPVTGTHRGRMGGRAREKAEHALRLLRIALQDHRFMHDDQLRFRLSNVHWFGEGSIGWRQREDANLELELDAELRAFAESKVDLTSLPLRHRNGFEKQALIAARWIERACFATDPLIALLYLFFALEALLGDTAEGLKGPKLAFRRVLLSSVVDGVFTHPNPALLLYDKVRSAAVHGEETELTVTEKDVQRFGSEVRAALNQYLAYGREQSVTRRSALLEKLEADPKKTELIEWLRQKGGKAWERPLNDLFGESSSEPDNPPPAAEGSG